MSKLNYWMEIAFDFVLWIAYISALVASYVHVVWAFNLFENQSSQWVGYVAAIGIDAGLFALAYVVQQKSQRQEPVKVFIGGIIFLAFISVFANGLHALAVVTGAENINDVYALLPQVDALQWLRVIFVSTTLPIVVIYLGEVVSIPGTAGIVAKLRDLIDQLESAVSQLKSDLNQSETAVSRLESQVSQLESQVSQLETELNHRDTAVHQYEADLKQRETAMARLESQVSQLEARLSRVEPAYTALNPAAKAAADYLAAKMRGESVSLQQVAEQAGVNKSKLQRLTASMNGSG